MRISPRIHAERKKRLEWVGVGGQSEKEHGSHGSLQENAHSYHSSSDHLMGESGAETMRGQGLVGLPLNKGCLVVCVYR